MGMRKIRTRKGVELRGSPSKRGWRSGLPGSMVRTPEQREFDARVRARWDRAFPGTVTARLGNGAWRFSDDPEGEYRDPPGPPMGTMRKEWEDGDSEPTVEGDTPAG